MKRQSRETRLKVPQRANHIIQCEDSTGDDLLQCRGCRECYDCNNLEHCHHCNELANDAKDCRDFCMWGIDCELVYECNGCGYSLRNCLFSNHCWSNIQNVLYCESCYAGVRDCFGCMGLQKAQYCILNKQYAKEEHEKLVLKLIDHMKKHGEWGEFFPSAISAYCYNESLAHEFFPLAAKEAASRGLRWQDETKATEQYMGPEVPVPETIAGIDDGICEKVLRCEATGKLYRIIAQEFRFYRERGLPLPRKSPQQRHAERMAARDRGVCGSAIAPSAKQPSKPRTRRTGRRSSIANPVIWPPCTDDPSFPMPSGFALRNLKGESCYRGALLSFLQKAARSTLEPWKSDAGNAAHHSL